MFKVEGYVVNLIFYQVEFLSHVLGLCCFYCETVKKPNLNDWYRYICVFLRERRE